MCVWDSECYLWLIILDAWFKETSVWSCRTIPEEEEDKVTVRQQTTSVQGLNHKLLIHSSTVISVMDNINKMLYLPIYWTRHQYQSVNLNVNNNRWETNVEMERSLHTVYNSINPFIQDWLDLTSPIRLAHEAEQRAFKSTSNGHILYINHCKW